MKVELGDLKTDVYDVREEVDEGHVEQIRESLKEDGQWNPIIVRPGENGDYELIAGHTRVRAATELGWGEIEATVKNIDDTEAEKLALKTNLKRKGMSKLEEGRVVNNLMTEYELSQAGVADKLGKSKSWVSDRVKVALNLRPEVKGLVEEGELSYSLARVVTQVEDDHQYEFAQLLIDQDISNGKEARQLAIRFLNDTLYTVGYEGRDFSEFVEILERTEIEILVDVRASTSSNYKPEFNGDVLADRLDEYGIEYRHVPELGVKNLIRKPYKDGAIGHDCFRDWYEWWVTEESGFDLDEFLFELEGEGTPAFMCIEEHASPSQGQDIYCHRHHLTEMAQSIERDGRALFPEREDV